MEKLEANPDGPIEPMKAQAKITLINKSQSAILFKVSFWEYKGFGIYWIVGFINALKEKDALMPLRV